MAANSDMTNIFDSYLIVDWSALSMPSPARPSRDAIWIGESHWRAEGLVNSESYWRTRYACEEYLLGRLQALARSGRRILLGCDFVYGYPMGFARAMGWQSSMPAWCYVWNEISALIQDDAQNRNNRFLVASLLNERCTNGEPGPFWGCPAPLTTPMLRSTSPGYPFHARLGISLERLRLAERQSPGVQPVWKLYGIGSVGGQTLVGIPMLNRLRDHPMLASFSYVWPFETDFASLLLQPPEGPFIIHAEIWPGLAKQWLDPAVSIRDQAQVRGTTQWLSHLDARGELPYLFEVPTGLSTSERQACLDEEGWIVGAGL